MKVSASLAWKTESNHFLSNLQTMQMDVVDDEKRVKRKFACHRFVVATGEYHVNRNRSMKSHFEPRISYVVEAKSFIGLYWRVKLWISVFKVSIDIPGIVG